VLTPQCFRVCLSWSAVVGSAETADVYDSNEEGGGTEERRRWRQRSESKYNDVFDKAPLDAP